MRFKSPEYNAFLKEIEARHSSTVRVLCAEGGPLSIGAVKIYVDGNIHRTPQRLSHLATPRLEVIPLVPGAHRIVVREFDMHKPNRAESNTVFIELAHGEEATLVVQFLAGSLTLSRVGA
jgi:hypothetical protein